MSRRRKQLSRLVRLRSRIRDRAALAHSADRLTEDEAKCKHEAASDLVASLPAGTEISAHELTRISLVVIHERDIFLEAGRRKEKSRSHLRFQANKLRSAEILQERHREFERNEANKTEQRQNDEIASRPKEKR